MTIAAQLKRIFKNDWFLGFILFLVFLVTNGYTYGWDDQHIEIPLLKSLIDPALYSGDYYVESLKQNFTSFLFPILAKIITVDQVPITYFILYLLSRFFLFFFAYKIWKFITQKEWSAALAVAAFILIGRVEEFLYRTFSHQEFALAIIMAGMFYFYKSRYLLAAILFGIAANFHALYSFFPFSYMAVYLLWESRKDRGAAFLKSVGIFVLCSMPFIIWTVMRLSTKHPSDPDWLELYKIACPQNFLFQDQDFNVMLRNFRVFLKGTAQFWPILGLLVLNLFTHPNFRKDQKSLVSIVMAWGYIFISFIFTYLFPNQLTLDLNLVRNLQFMQFILIGYTTILIIDQIQIRSPWTGLFLLILFSLFRFGNYTCFLACISMLILLTIPVTKSQKIMRLLLFLLSVGILAYQFKINSFNSIALKTFYLTVLLLCLIFVILQLTKQSALYQKIRPVLIMIPFLTIGGNFIYYHYLHLKVEKQGGGFWQLQRNWIDLQNYVQGHTPKDSIFLTPNDMEMGGFRIFSERKVVCCYRDCGIVGFDFQAAREWQKRMNDIEHFKVHIDGDIRPAIENAITKYHADYIIFMRYTRVPQGTIFQPVYENEVFALYKIQIKS